jgi:hypothetical protein
MVEQPDGGRFAGRVGLCHPDGWDEPELNWMIVPEMRGKGLAVVVSPLLGRLRPFKKPQCTSFVALTTSRRFSDAPDQNEKTGDVSPVSSTTTND